MNFDLKELKVNIYNDNKVKSLLITFYLKVNSFTLESI